MMVVRVTLGDTFTQDVPQRLFALQGYGNPQDAQYDVNADGMRFLFREQLAEMQNAPITVVRNWWVGLGR
jgi:hypothetical protein